MNNSFAQAQSAYDAMEPEEQQEYQDCPFEPCVTHDPNSPAWLPPCKAYEEMYWEWQNATDDQIAEFRMDYEYARLPEHLANRHAYGPVYPYKPETSIIGMVEEDFDLDDHPF